MTDRPFDISVRDLAEQDPLSWSRLGETRSVDRAEIIDADISTVTASADKVLRVYSGAHEWLMNLEAVSSHDAPVARRMHLKSVMLEERHDLPVRSILLLLRRDANARQLTGTLKRNLPGQRKAYNTFHYEILRLWEMPLQSLLAGGLGTLPLAALTDEAESDLRGVVEQIHTRLRNEAPRAAGAKAATSLFLLLGLRYDSSLIRQLFEGLRTMQDSSTYQWIVQNSRLTESRTLLMRLATKKYGPPPQEVVQRLNQVAEIERLESLAERVLDATGWDELLTPLQN